MPRGVARMSFGDRAAAIADFSAAVARARRSRGTSAAISPKPIYLPAILIRHVPSIAPFVGANSRDAASLVLAGRIAGQSGNNALAASLLRNAVALRADEVTPRRLLVEALLRGQDSRRGTGDGARRSPPVDPGQSRASSACSPGSRRRPSAAPPPLRPSAAPRRCPMARRPMPI